MALPWPRGVKTGVARALGRLTPADAGADRRTDTATATGVASAQLDIPLARGLMRPVDAPALGIGRGLIGAALPRLCRGLARFARGRLVDGFSALDALVYLLGRNRA